MVGFFKEPRIQIRVFQIVPIIGEVVMPHIVAAMVFVSNGKNHRLKQHT